MDTSHAVGAYMNKEAIGAIMKKFRIPLAMTALVHEHCAIKHPSYSWLQSPETSNSTIAANLDAIDRHLSAYSMGKTMDVEGLPHLFHLVCRTSMMVTTYLRMFTSGERVTAVRGDNAELNKWAAACLGSQITSEEILVCSKELPPEFSMLDSMPACEIYPLIRATLADLHLFIEERNLEKDLSKPDLSMRTEYISPSEILCRLIYQYSIVIWERDKYEYEKLFSSMPLEIFRNEERAFMLKYLGVDTRIEPDMKA